MRRLAILLLLPLLLGAQYGKPQSGTDVGGWDAGNCANIGDDDNGLTGTTGDGTTANEDDGSSLACSLQTLTDPEVDTGHVFRCRRYRSSNKANTFTAELCNTSGCTDGNDPIATNSGVTVTDSSATTVSEGTVTAANINSYGTLWVVITATGSNPTDIFVAGCELEIPDAPATGRTRRMF